MVTPDIHQERHRLLLSMRDAPDHYELAFSSSEHAGYLRGLSKSGVISDAASDIYAQEADQVVQIACQRLSSEAA